MFKLKRNIVKRACTESTKYRETFCKGTRTFLIQSGSRVQTEKANNIKNPQKPHHHGKQTDVDVKKKKEKNKSKYFLPPKQFQARQSLLFQLFEENRNIRVVINMFLACSMMFILAYTLKEYIHNHRLPTALNVISHCFGKLHLAGLVWIANNFCTVLTYFCFMLWGRIRQKVNTKGLWDKMCILLLVGYYTFSFVAATVAIFYLNLPFGSATIVSMESIRFLMKVHAFVRENAAKMLLLNSEKDKLDLPTFSKFLYFLYIPTVVYKDEYPRSEKIRWSFVCCRVIEIFAAIIYLAYLFEYVTTSYFKSSCIKPHSLLELALLYIEFSLPVTVMLCLMFLIIIHSTQNAMGEAMQFGDRLFYADWWASTDVQQYYRKWNMVIGDWLYTYIYKDMYQFVAPGKINLAKFVTILVSALAHEWIATVASGYFLPVLSTIMIISAMCMYIKVNQNSNVANVIAFMCIMLGASYMGTFYSLEYFARKNFPTKQTFGSVFWTENCVSL